MRSNDGNTGNAWFVRKPSGGSRRWFAQRVVRYDRGCHTQPCAPDALLTPKKSTRTHAAAPTVAQVAILVHGRSCSHAVNSLAADEAG